MKPSQANPQAANVRMLSRLMMRLLPAQILLQVVGAISGMVTSLFASNLLGVESVSALGMFAPLNNLIGALAIILSGGTIILCGKYVGQNQQRQLDQTFSLSMVLATAIGAVMTCGALLLVLFDATAFLAADPAVRPLFNRYLTGQCLTFIPFLLSNQLPAFLSMEGREGQTMKASLVCLALDVLFAWLFVVVLHMGILGLALASALSMWGFLAVLALPFLRGRMHVHFSLRGLCWRESLSILRIGFPGGAGRAYEMIRCLIVNGLVVAFVGSVGLSAFAASDSFLRLFWAVPVGMAAVSRLLISVSIGEEDRQTLTDVLRVMFRRYLPIELAVCAAIIACAVPVTRAFFQDPAEPVFGMTVWALRILPLCMPFSLIVLHFIYYAQASGKHLLVNLLSLLDGVVCVAGFTALLIRWLGMNSVYVANVLNGVVCCLVIVAYAWIVGRRFPRNMAQLMVVPDSFGAPEEDRMDLSVRSVADVVTVARNVQAFCLARGVDGRRAAMAGLALEEMAGNIVEHGFTKDRRRHSVDVRVVRKDDDVILRLKDDCVPFDPDQRRRMTDGSDPVKNIGLRIVYGMAKDVTYQNVTGLNVLTIRI